MVISDPRGRLGARALALLALLLLAADPGATAHAVGTAESSQASALTVEATQGPHGSLLGSLGEVDLASAAPQLSSTATQACTPEFGSFKVGNWPPACWRPYGPSSPFNTPIPENPTLAPESAAIVKYMRRHHWAIQNDGTNTFVWDAGGSRPVYWSQKSDPLVKVNCNGKYVCQSGMEVRIPAGAKPENSSDGHMTVVDQAAGLEYDFGQATTPEHGEMTISGGNSIPIGAGSGTGLGGYADAAHLGLLGGVIRAPELAAGKIEHALETTVECVQSADVWPSPENGTGDAVCRHGRAGPHFASLLQLNMSEAEIAATQAPAWEQTIMRAMAHYGIYVVDTNGPHEREMSLVAEDDQAFTSFGYEGEMSKFVKSVGGTSQLVGVPISVSNLRVIAPCVPERTC